MIPVVDGGRQPHTCIEADDVNGQADCSTRPLRYCDHVQQTVATRHTKLDYRDAGCTSRLCGLRRVEYWKCILAAVD
jgi:hypothetical protein